MNQRNTTATQCHREVSRRVLGDSRALGESSDNFLKVLEREREIEREGSRESIESFRESGSLERDSGDNMATNTFSTVFIDSRFKHQTPS